MSNALHLFALLQKQFLFLLIHFYYFSIDPIRHGFIVGGTKSGFINLLHMHKLLQRRGTQAEISNKLPSYILPEMHTSINHSFFIASL